MFSWPRNAHTCVMVIAKYWTSSIVFEFPTCSDVFIASFFILREQSFYTYIILIVANSSDKYIWDSFTARCSSSCFLEDLVLLHDFFSQAINVFQMRGNGLFFTNGKFIPDYLTLVYISYLVCLIYLKKENFQAISGWEIALYRDLRL